MDIINICRVNIFDSIEDILGKLSISFDSGSEVVQLQGFCRKIYCFKNYDHIHEILTNKNSGFRKCPGIMPRVKYVMGTGGYIQNDFNTWQFRRRQVQKSFTTEILKKYKSDSFSTAIQFIENRSIKINRDLNVTQLLYEVIITIIFKIFFTYDLGAQEREQVVRFTSFINKNFVRFVPLGLPIPSTILFKKYVNSLKLLFIKIISHRKNNHEAANDLLDNLINIRKEGGQLLNIEEVVGEIFSIYFGASVMATSLTWCLVELSKNIEYQILLENESNGFMRARLDEADEKPFSLKVIEETLRLYPPSWGYPRFAQEAMTISNYIVPKKSLLLPMIWHLHRDQILWPSPMTFDPFRFSEKNSFVKEYLPFGAGPRTCLGVKLGPILMQSVLRAIFLKFKFEPVQLEPKLEFGFEIHPKDEVYLNRFVF